MRAAPLLCWAGTCMWLVAGWPGPSAECGCFKSGPEAQRLSSWAQRYIVRIIFMIPVYSLASFPSLLAPENAIYWLTVRDWCAREGRGWRGGGAMGGSGRWQH